MIMIDMVTTQNLLTNPDNLILAITLLGQNIAMIQTS